MPASALGPIHQLVHVDRLIHEPARHLLMAYLYVIDAADFIYLRRQTGFSAGNISSHMTKLEQAGYVDVEKSFVDKRPRTLFRLTPAGRRAFETYHQTMREVLRAIDTTP